MSTISTIVCKKARYCRKRLMSAAHNPALLASVAMALLSLLPFQRASGQIADDYDAPTLTVAPSGNVTQTSITVTVRIADNYTINSASAQVFQDGIDRTSNFAFATSSGCGATACAELTGTLSVPTSGSTTVTALACDYANNCGEGSSQLTYTPPPPAPTVDVTQVGSATISVAAYTASTQQFTVSHLTSGSASYALSARCSGVVATCSRDSATVSFTGPGNKTVTVSFSVGQGTTGGQVGLVAVNASNATKADSSFVAVAATGTQPMLITWDFNNNDHQRSDICANACFAAVHRQSTVPFFTGLGPQAVSLVYSSDRVAPRPFIYADVKLLPGATKTPQRLELRVRVNGVDRPFLNGSGPTYGGETVLTFAGSGLIAGTKHRLGGQIDASDLATGTYPMRIVVSTVYTDMTVKDSTITRLLVVNDAAGTVARGWRVSGWSRLYPDSAGVLLVDGADAIYYEKNTYDATLFNPSTDEFSSIRNYPGSRYVRSTADSTKYFYSTTGMLDSIVDRLKIARKFTYDGAGRLTRIYDPIRQRFVTFPTQQYVGGLYTQLNYTATGFLNSIVEPSGNWAGRVTRVVIDEPTKTIREVIDPDSGSTRFTYTASFRLDTIVDRMGARWRYEYDDRSGKVTAFVRPAIQADTGNGALAIVTPRTVFSPWQRRGVPVTTTGTSSSAWAAPLRADSMYSTIRGASTGTVKLFVNRWGQPTLRVGALGDTLRVSYSGRFPVQIYDARNRVDSLAWAIGKVRWTRAYKQDATEITFGAYGLPTALSVNGVTMVTYAFDSIGRLRTETYGPGLVRTHYPDRFGRDTLVTDAQGHWTRLGYEPLSGQLTLQQTAKTVHRRYYDEFGRQTVEALVGQAQITMSYDVLNRMTEILAPLSDSATKFAYDRLRPVSVTDAQGHVHKVARNAAGWPVLEFDPNNPTDTSKARQYTYGPDGLLRSALNRKGLPIRMLYDSVGRLIQRSSVSQTGDTLAPTETYRRSSDGRWLVIQNRWSRDSIVVGREGGDTTYTMLGGGTFIRVRSPEAVPSGEGSRSVDTTSFRASGTGIDTSAFKFRLRRLVHNAQTWAVDTLAFGDAVVSYARDAELRVDTAIARLNSTSFIRAYSYDADHQLTGVDFSANSGSALQSMFGRSYAYDSLGRINEERYTDDSLPARRTIGYDAAGRLVTTDVSHQRGGTYSRSAELGVSMTYTHDPLNNLARQRDDVSGVADTAVIAGVNRLASWRGTSYGYDAEGNRISRSRAGSNDVTYQWNSYGQLVSVATGSGASADTSYYGYNARGRLVRIEKRRSGTRLSVRYFLWDDANVIAEIDSSANGLVKLAEYVYAGMDAPVAVEMRNSNGLPEVRFFERDEYSNVLGTYNAAVTDRYKYDAWGRTSAQGGWRPRQLWKGMFFEGDSTQLYYARNRWYDPAARRFISEDPVGFAGGANFYAFAAGDPINHRDPLGLGPCLSETDLVESVRVYWDNRSNQWEVEIKCKTGGGQSYVVMAPTVTRAQPPARPMTESKDSPMPAPLGRNDPDRYEPRDMLTISNSATLGFDNSTVTCGPTTMQCKQSDAWVFPPQVGISLDVNVAHPGAPGDPRDPQYGWSWGLGRYAGVTLQFDGANRYAGTTFSFGTGANPVASAAGPIGWLIPTYSGPNPLATSRCGYSCGKNGIW